jgi:hypothetical protein
MCVLNLGFGVTAYSETHARSLVAEAFNRGIVAVEVITDMRSIDQRHVAPNIGNHFERGIWFSLGYSRKDHP